jgi:hypothetical protein
MVVFMVGIYDKRKKILTLVFILCFLLQKNNTSRLAYITSLKPNFYEPK